VRRCAGFTLVELIVTVAVVGLLAAFGASYLLAGLPALRANAAARQLMGDFRLARTLAVDRNLDVLIQFHSPGANDYTMAVDTFPAAPSGDDRITDDDELVKVVSLGREYVGIEFTPYAAAGLPADGVAFADNRANFNPDGHTNGGSVYLRPAADAGRTRSTERQVTVIASTGRVRIKRWNGTIFE
jgi:prepilin-type N-terminal cleavage/methylation domain-containing protein